jgi:phytanoyl-CoA dioxygenase PhyH
VSGTQPFVDSTALTGRPAALRDRLRADGYLFLRGQVKVAALDRVRSDFLTVMARHGWLSGPPEERVADGAKFCVEPQPSYRTVYHEAYRSEAFHQLPHSLVGPLLGGIVGTAVLVHPRPIGRVVFPSRHAPAGADYTTPAHQDFVSVQGTPDTYTAWVPLHDVQPELGPLAVAAGSHRDGVRPRVPAFGTGGTEIADTEELVWHSGPFQRGDVLIFHSMTVHKGTPNRTDRFRISTDFRFQSAEEPINERSLELSSGTLTWDSLYRDWRDDSLKYYWRALNPTIAPFDESYERDRNQQAIALAERGDLRTVSTLQRIAVHDPDATLREQALSLLTRLGATL